MDRTHSYNSQEYKGKTFIYNKSKELDRRIDKWRDSAEVVIV